ncbi:MAG: transglutaminase family protein [Pirellulaceae bacterium]|nr:transglutaminase family protein [Pirellulaceae bacterium]
MAIRVALHHVTTYHYDKLINLGPQIIRLRPAPHCRTPIVSYSLKVSPHEHFVNWQQDPHSNFQARFVCPKPTRMMRIEVDVVAEMTVINPFDFFVEQAAEEFPFEYDASLMRDLRPFMELLPLGTEGKKFLASLDRTPRRTVTFLVDLNRRVQEEIGYTIRLEPGVQSVEETLKIKRGSCRDSAWLFVQMARQLGFAARFVSGYLIQLTADVKSLDGPSGPESDFTDLHAWAEVFIPGAGWIGLDPTSGLMAGEGHIPLACTPDPQTAAPISGALAECKVDFEFQMNVTRVHEDPRVTKPYTPEQWKAIETLGHQLDQRLQSDDVRLTMGGEPTFVSIDDMEGAEWNSAAVGPHKRRLSEVLIKRLRERFAPGGLLHYGQGKWYPGESLPRWSLGCYWRRDGLPIWQDPKLIADIDHDYGLGLSAAARFTEHLSSVLNVTAQFIRPAYEDIAHYVLKEARLPVNVDPRDPKLKDPEERARMAKVFERGIEKPVGLVLPLQRQWWQSKPRWVSGPWPTRSERLFLLPGDSPIGLRLPLEALPVVASHQILQFTPADPTAALPPLPHPLVRKQDYLDAPKSPSSIKGISEQERPAPVDHGGDQLPESIVEADGTVTGGMSVRTALCVEPRHGRLHIFLPPVESLEDYLEIVSAVEATADHLQMPVVVEGYLPPNDPRLNNVKVTPDPGVIEVNIHPGATWSELVENTTILYEEARLTRLGTEKFDLDGKHSGTGGGNHVVIGAATPLNSPFLRRPDLLRSLIGYWNNHPSLSYLFSGRFVGPTSQAPRVDEGRLDAIYELQLAFDQVPSAGTSCPPWMVDRIFRNLLIDLTGNTHRAEFCIDKLYSPDSSTGRLGLLEFRGFEMPPHAQMSLTQQLLIRALVSHFWREPYSRPLTVWGTALHDRFMLPHFVWEDFADVLGELQTAGIAIERAWFAPHYEFKFPIIGDLNFKDLFVEFRTAIEPWNVLGEEPGGGGTVRFVDSSVERLQVKVSGLYGERFAITCQGRRLPLHPTGVPGEYVAGVRYRAWAPPSALHPTIPVHTPLVFDILDTWTNRSLGGCTYHVSHPAGRNYQTFPVNAFEAEARRAARYFRMGHSPGYRTPPTAERNPAFPLTLDLRRNPNR